MEIEFLTEENKKNWDEFALKSDMAWFRHTTAWQKYSECCRFDSNTKNRSFMVKQNNQIIAIVPLLTEYSYPDRNGDCFSMYGDYTPLPALINNCEINTKNIFDKIKEVINEIANNDCILTGKYTIEPLITYNYAGDFAFFNLLTEGAQLDFSTTNIVDLKSDENIILQKMRKGHKAAIKQVLKEKPDIVIFDKSNISKDILLRFKEIHKIDSGFQTRTDASWECMYEWILADNAILAMYYDKNSKEYLSGALIMVYKKAAYYASYATVSSDLLNGHVGYILQWEVIKYLKKIGIEVYDIGRNEFSEQHLTDEKLQNIAKYKKGFRSREAIVINYLQKYDFKTLTESVAE